MNNDQLLKACKKYDFSFLGIFGSHARGENKADSDLDLLVKFKKRKSLLDMVRIEREMSESLGLKVDLVTEKSVSPYLRDSIMRGLKIVYDSKR
ncbi:MAG: nucleotidyltransferase family protein [bacterium]